MDEEIAPPPRVAQCLLFNTYFIVFNDNSAVAEKPYGFGKYLPFRLFHNTSLKYFGSVALLYLNSLLKHDRSCVALGSHDMHRRARNLNALLQRRLVDVKSVKSLSAEGRNQRGVDVQNSVGECLVDLVVKDGQKSCKHNEVDFL